MPNIAFQDLVQYGQDIFVAAGSPYESARYVAQRLVHANLTGHDSHGVIRIAQYLAAIQNRELLPDRLPKRRKQEGSLLWVDGQRGFGQLAAKFAVEQGLQLLQEHRLALVACHNLNHAGRIGDYTSMAAENGALALCFCNGGGPNVAPYGAKQRIMGTNPMALSVPLSPGRCMEIDFASAATAEGKIRVARNRRAPLPPDQVIDKHGHASTDANAFYDGGSILPMGRHKGSALSLVLEILAGVFTGAKCSVFDEYEDGNGLLFLLTAPDAFVPRHQFDRDIRRLHDAVVHAEPAAEQSVLFPGGPEHTQLQYRRLHGVELDGRSWETVLEAGNRLNIIPPAFS